MSFPKEEPMSKGTPASPALMAAKSSGHAAPGGTSPGAVSTNNPASGVIGPNNVVAPVQMSGSEALVRSLEELGVKDVFGLPGGAILPTYDPLMASSLNHVLVRHEQGATPPRAMPW
jgi:acetolactate synthase-1/2/3 large subunit